MAAHDGKVGFPVFWLVVFSMAWYKICLLPDRGSLSFQAILLSVDSASHLYNYLMWWKREYHTEAWTANCEASPSSAVDQELLQFQLLPKGLHRKVWLKMWLWPRPFEYLSYFIYLFIYLFIYSFIREWRGWMRWKDNQENWNKNSLRQIILLARIYIRPE